VGVSRLAVLALLALNACGRIGFGLDSAGNVGGGGGGGDGGTLGDGGGPLGDGRLPDASPGTSAIKLVGAGGYQSWIKASDQTLPVGIPTGTLDGDLMVMHATWAENLGTWAGPVFGGWKSVVAPWTDPRCASSGSAVYMQIAVDLDMMPEPQATCTGFCNAAIISFRGIDPVTPIEAIGVAGTTNETDPCDKDLTPQLQVVPGLTTSTDGDLVVLLYGDNNDDNVTGPSTQSEPAGFTTLYNDLADVTMAENFLAGSLAQTAAGSVADQTVTTTNENLFGWTGVMLALKPAPP
jgi:hypothetical protein